MNVSFKHALCCFNTHLEACNVLEIPAGTRWAGRATTARSSIIAAVKVGISTITWWWGTEITL